MQRLNIRNSAGAEVRRGDCGLAGWCRRRSAWAIEDLGR